MDKKQNVLKEKLLSFIDLFNQSSNDIIISQQLYNKLKSFYQLFKYIFKNKKFISYNEIVNLSDDEIELINRQINNQILFVFDKEKEVYLLPIYYHYFDNFDKIKIYEKEINKEQQNLTNLIRDIKTHFVEQINSIDKEVVGDISSFENLSSDIISPQKNNANTINNNINTNDDIDLLDDLNDEDINIIKDNLPKEDELILPQETINDEEIVKQLNKNIFK